MTAPLLPSAFLSGKYRVERILGQGGMGVVVAATHLALQEQVAIKVLLPDIARDADTVARFLQEARAQVRIRGDHVVRVLDVETDPVVGPIMIMEMLSGTDLAKVIETRGALPVDEAIDFVLQAAEALAQAHALGMVHRDIKPQNMFLTAHPDGSPLVKVLDFGISKVDLLGSATRRAMSTNRGGLLGSPAYMSPEQVRNPKTVTARSDIWSLGVVLYEMLTDRMPFEDSTLTALLTSIMTRPPIDIRQRRALPPALASVVMRCLSKNPDERPRDVAELARALATDPRSHERAKRICHIIQRASVRPPALTDPSLLATVALDADAATVAGLGPSFEGAMTERVEAVPASSVTLSGKAWQPRSMKRGMIGGAVAVMALVATFAIGATHRENTIVIEAPAETKPPARDTIPSPAAAPSPTLAAVAAPAPPAPTVAPVKKGRPARAKPAEAKAEVKMVEAKPAEAKPAEPPPDLYDSRK